MVLARIWSTNSSDTFVYNSGDICYKPYILSKKKSQHEDENVEDCEGDMVEIDDLPSQNLLASGTLREKPISRKNICDINCVVCNKFTKNKIYYRLEFDSRAKKFLKITNNWVDDVHNHVPACTDVHRLYGADLYYHEKLRTKNRKC